jgi:hypothetical protein
MAVQQVFLRVFPFSVKGHHFTNLSPAHEECVSHDQAAHLRTPGSFLTGHLTGLEAEVELEDSW